MDWTHPIMVALAGATLPSLLALLAYLKARDNSGRTQKMELNLNGTLKELVAQLTKITGEEAFSRGELKGAANERARTAKQEDE